MRKESPNIKDIRSQLLVKHDEWDIVEDEDVSWVILTNKIIIPVNVVTTWLHPSDAMDLEFIAPIIEKQKQKAVHPLVILWKDTDKSLRENLVKDGYDIVVFKDFEQIISHIEYIYDSAEELTKKWEDIGDKLIRIGTTLTSDDKAEREKAIIELVEEMWWMERPEQYQRELKRGFDPTRFFVITILKDFISHMRKHFSVGIDSAFVVSGQFHKFAMELYDGFAEKMGEFLVEFFKEENFRLDLISDAIAKYYELIDRINKQEKERYKVISEEI